MASASSETTPVAPIVTVPNRVVPPVAPRGAAVPVPNSHGEKPEKFTVADFKRWQQKILFYLTTLNLARFLSDDAPKLKEGEGYVESVSALEAYSLYNVYCEKKTTKELWESLDIKYKTEDAGAKKFLVGRFLDFKMVDSKLVVSQVQEIQVILHEIHSEGMTLSESFQVAAIFEKLPPAWKDFKNYLKHKRKEMNVEELIVRLRIEEDNKSSERRLFSPVAANENVDEHGQSSKKKHFNPSNKRMKMRPKGGITKKKFSGNASTVMVLVTRPLSARSQRKTEREWWIDTGATRHVCSDKEMFANLNESENGEVLFMGNSSTSEIKGQ
ncbi:uncharacterized protein [Henckelia pumila]|uniref:uncharacterized protein n=1 Tax=Henckelia pumila TaxID=405737 RepID=UPI003C6E3B80